MKAPANLASERLKRQIDRLLDEVEAAVSQLDWLVVRDRTQAVLALDPENADAATFLAAAERALNPSVSILQPLSSVQYSRRRPNHGVQGRSRPGPGCDKPPCGQSLAGSDRCRTQRHRPSGHLRSVEPQTGYIRPVRRVRLRQTESVG